MITLGSLMICPLSGTCSLQLAACSLLWYNLQIGSLCGVKTRCLIPACLVQLVLLSVVWLHPSTHLFAELTVACQVACRPTQQILSQPGSDRRCSNACTESLSLRVCCAASRPWTMGKCEGKRGWFGHYYGSQRIGMNCTYAQETT